MLLMFQALGTFGEIREVQAAAHQQRDTDDDQEGEEELAWRQPGRHLRDASLPSKEWKMSDTLSTGGLIRISSATGTNESGAHELITQPVLGNSICGKLL